MITQFAFDRFAESVREFFFLIVHEVDGLRMDLDENTRALRENTESRLVAANKKDSDAAPR